MSTETSPYVAPLTESESAAPRLRLWPGAALVALVWLVRLGVNLGPGSPSKFFYGSIVTPLVATLGLNLWWLLASRVKWGDRLLVVGAFLAIAGATVLVCGANFPPMALILYALPVAATVWVGWLLVTEPAGWLLLRSRLRWLPSALQFGWPARKYGLVVLFLLMSAAFGVLRVDGMDGSFQATFNWRWTPTAEERLLSELSHEQKDAPNAAILEPATVNSPKLELQPGDWPGFRGAARDGRLTGARIATDWEQSPPREVWRRRVGPGWSSFAVVGDRVFTQEQLGSDELVACYDADSGAKVWSHSNATRFTEVVAGPGPRATPTFHDGWIYALGANGNLDCLDAATGAARWSRDIVADSGATIPQWGFSSSPLIVDDIVTVFAGGPEGKSVLGYRAATGELAWAAGEGALSYCSTQLVRLDGVDQLLIATDVGLTAFRPATGEVLWVHRWPSEGVARVVQPAMLGDSDVLIGTGMNLGSRRINVSHDKDTWPTKELWTSRAIKPYYNDLVVYQDSLYGFDGAIFMCVGLDDGKTRWKARGYGNGQVLLLMDQGLLLVLSEQGDVALVEAQPKKHKEIARFKALEGKTWNHPVIAHGKLFVRNAEEAACFELKMAPDSEAQAAR